MDAGRVLCEFSRIDVNDSWSLAQRVLSKEFMEKNRSVDSNYFLTDKVKK